MGSAGKEVSCRAMYTYKEFTKRGKHVVRGNLPGLTDICFRSLEAGCRIREFSEERSGLNRDFTNKEPGNKNKTGLP